MKIRLALIPIALLIATGAEAEIYKCVAEDGSVAYSQIPCPKQKTTTVTAATPKDDGVINCRWATQFATDVGRRMRSGLPSDAVFNFYGGVDSVSPGTLNIINYVYRFRGNEAMPLERISSLAGSMCKAGSLGDVRCESLPYGQDDTGEACNPDATVNPADAVGARHAGEEEVARVASSENEIARMAGSNDVATDQCKKRYRDQIDAIDAQMRSGYDSAQGEAYRERLRVLTSSLRAC
jgi:Domain of unknown function (DUF4124)